MKRITSLFIWMLVPALSFGGTVNITGPNYPAYATQLQVPTAQITAVPNSNMPATVWRSSLFESPSNIDSKVEYMTITNVDKTNSVITVIRATGSNHRFPILTKRYTYSIQFPITYPTNTRTNTPTATNTPTNTATKTATVTSTSTPTNTATNTRTNTATNTATKTATATATNTATNTATVTGTLNTSTPTNTRTSTATNTATNTVTATVTATPTNTPTPIF